MRTARVFLALSAASLLTGCELASRALVHTTMDVVHGSGQAMTVEPPVVDFHEVDVRGALQATVAIGDGPKVVLRGDDNIVPLVLVEVVDGRLIVRPRPNTSFEVVTPLEVTITATSLSALQASGASRIELAALKAEHLDIEATGASQITLGGVELGDLQVEAHGAAEVSVGGAATSARFDASGASKVVAAGLNLDALQVDLSGASSGEVQVRELVTGSLSGASNLKVHGGPPERSVATSGASQVAFVDAG